MVHATFQYGGALGKQTRLREAMLWQDPPAYRSEPRLLSIQLHQLRLASAKLEALTDEQMIAVHLTNMEQVLSQVGGLGMLPCITAPGLSKAEFPGDEHTVEV